MSAEAIFKLWAFKWHGYAGRRLWFNGQNHEAVPSGTEDTVELVFEFRQFVKPVSARHARCCRHSCKIGEFCVDYRIAADDLVAAVIDNEMHKVRWLMMSLGEQRA